MIVFVVLMMFVIVFILLSFAIALQDKWSFEIKFMAIAAIALLFTYPIFMMAAGVFIELTEKGLV